MTARRRRFLEASLAKWTRRLTARRKLLLAARRKGDLTLIAKRERQVRQAAEKVELRETQLGRKHRRRLWLPGARVIRGRDAGAFVRKGLADKLVWHTTEGSSVDGAVGAYRASGSWPHFTYDPHRDVLVQHLPLNRSGRALEHPSGTIDTNRLNAIQVELVGFAASTSKWGEKEYARIARLARRIEAQTAIPRACSVTFTNTPRRMTAATWANYRGHCGHQHVPSNHHWDPGAFRIARVLQEAS